MLFGLTEELLGFEYVATVLVGAAVIGLVRRDRNYWPALRLSFAIHVARSCYFGTAAILEMQGRAEEALTFRQAPYSLLVTGAVLLVMAWCLWLVLKQNHLDRRGTVTMTGAVEPTTLTDVRRDMSRSLVTAAEIERDAHP